MAVWAARAGLSQDAAVALRRARQAEARLGPQGAGENRAWRWTQALALGEQAAAWAALRRPAEAAERATAALQAWGDEPPALFAASRARDTALVAPR